MLLKLIVIILLCFIFLLPTACFPLLTFNFNLPAFSYKYKK